MRILIFGGLGFIGANLAEALSEYELYVAHRPGSREAKPQVARFVAQYATLLEYTDPATAFEKTRPHVVINLVGQYYGRSQELWQANAEFPRLLCDAARRAGWRGKVVHFSAATVRGPVGAIIEEEELHLHGVVPDNDFDRSKAAGEEAVANCFNDWVIVRPALVYGRFNTHPEWVTLTRFVKRGVAPMLKARVSAISVRELAKVVKASLALARQYFFATECQPRPLSEFVRAIAKALGRRVVPIPIPTAVLHIAASPEFKRHLPYLDKAFSCEKMRRLLGLEPRPNFETEVREMVESINV
ncbi:NAD-dependent epimerase/dehydratase [Pyrobaculum islandicum DSM 4184]|uniref:NAD-dependent epimerase/dehydratase n=1 Tax=Pyrobaculum islandicum (strain DSM 4184 / JCM 9189 / GEO3) TaxID=384616 RepID=A1RQF6_PYRIL|nr:NAD(P)-dependent oxidoreductase [Pyrobaculum islandicum]ABL87188.1 NAD-dependent epimerase/dehydratase [Pyrobaculum islandicum DSM 4184]